MTKSNRLAATLRRVTVLYIVSLCLVMHTFAAPGKFRIDRLGSPEELRKFCVNKGFAHYASSGSLDDGFYIICVESDHHNPESNSLEFVDHVVHQISSILGSSNVDCLDPQTQKRTHTDSLHEEGPSRKLAKVDDYSPAGHFLSVIENGQIKPLGMLNSLNEGYVDRNKIVKDSFSQINGESNLMYSQLSQDLLQSSDGPSASHAFIEIPEMYHLVDGFLNRLAVQAESHPQLKPILEYLRGEFEYLRKTKTMTSTWVKSLPARWLVAQSLPSEDEIEVYRHVLNSDRYSRLFTPNLWKNAELFNQLLPEPVGQVVYSSYPMPDDAMKLIQANLLQPEPEYSIVENRNFLDPLALCLSYLHANFPLVVAKPGSKLPAHGITQGLSPFGHFYHDFFHAGLFNSANILENWGIYHGKEAAKNKVDLNQYFPSVLPLAAQRLQGFKNLVQTILDVGMSDANNGGPVKVKEFKGAVAGAFLALHEYPGFSPYLLDETSAAKSIAYATTSSMRELDSSKSWESPFDPFGTSAETGLSPLNDSQILETPFVLDRIRDELKDYPIKDVSVKKREVKRSNRFIDVNITLSDSKRINISSATYYHKLTNSEDNYRLLSYGGLVTDSLKELHDTAFAQPSNRIAIEKYLTELQNSLKGAINKFNQLAVEVVHRKSPSNPDTDLETVYREWASQIFQRMSQVTLQS